MRKILNRSKDRGAEYSEIYKLDRRSDEVSFKSGKLEGISAKDISGFSLLVQKDGKLGSVSSSNYNRTEEIIEMALASAGVGDRADYDFNSPTDLSEIDFDCESLWDASYDRYIADGEKAVGMFREYDPGIMLDIKFNRIREAKEYLNTNSCDYYSQNDILRVGLQANLIQEDSLLQTGLSYHTKTNDYSIEEFAGKLIEKVKLGREETDLAGGRMPVLLTPEALSQIAYALVAGLSGESVRQGVSPLKGRIDEQVFDEQITLIDDLTLEEGSESARFDDQGTRAERTVLYQNGVLKNYLLDLKSASQLDMKPNGKAFRKQWWKPTDPAQSPSPWFSNWTIEPGRSSLEEMIADIKEGLVIENIMGLIMGNLVKGDIDSDIVMGYKIENGRIVGRVKDAALGTNIYDIFKDKVLAVENRQHFASSLSGHMLLPHILLKDINIIK